MQLLTDAGYKPYPVGPLSHADAFWQKRVTDKNGTRYFINVDVYEMGIEFSVQFETGAGHAYNVETVQWDCEDENDLRQIEIFFATVWERMAANYYERTA